MEESFKVWFRVFHQAYERATCVQPRTSMLDMGSRRHGLLICLIIAGAVLAQAVFHPNDGLKHECISFVGTIDGGLCDGLNIDGSQCVAMAEAFHMADDAYVNKVSVSVSLSLSLSPSPSLHLSLHLPLFLSLSLSLPLSLFSYAGVESFLTLHV